MTKSFEFPDLVDWRVLQAERNVARAERRTAQAERRAVEAEQAAGQAATAAEAALQREQQRAGALQAELDQLHASTSWRVSHPVRVASRLLQALRQPPPQAPALFQLPEAAPPQAKATPLPLREQAILQRLQGSGRD